MPTFQHAIGQGRASCEGGSPLFRSKTKAMAEMMCAWRTRGRSLQKNRSNCRPVRCCRGDGTVRARERGDLWAPSAPPAHLPRAQAPCLPRRPIRGKITIQAVNKAAQTTPYLHSGEWRLQGVGYAWRGPPLYVL